MSAHPEETLVEFPEKTPLLRRLFMCWDSGLLILTLLAMVGMAGYLLWPQPKAHITLRTMAPASSVLSVPAETSVMEDTSDKPQFYKKDSRKKGHHPRTVKKPSKPPVLNLNTATLQQLQLLPGIGPKMAERVMEYRKSNGGFKTPEQIMEVKGIGPKKFEKLKPFLKI